MRTLNNLRFWIFGLIALWPLAVVAQSLELIFVLRDTVVSEKISDVELVALNDKAHAECRFETDRAVAFAGSVVIPGSPGIGYGGSGSALAGALDNLSRSLTATPPQVIPGMASRQQWQFYLSCMSAKGYWIYDRAGYERAKAELISITGVAPRGGVGRTYE